MERKMADIEIIDDGFAPDSAIARYLGVHPKSLPRWDRRPELSFPKPIYINGRKFRKWSEIREFTRQAAVAHAAKVNS
jgi:hypothetical protein